MELVDDMDAEFFHDDSGTGFAALPVDGRCEIHSMNSKTFRLWLTRLFYGETGKPANADSIKTVIGVLMARAIFDGSLKKLSLRIAEDSSGEWFYDIGRPNWEALRITNDGWRVEANPPILFKRRGNNGAQVMPMNDPTGRGVARFFDFVNIKNEFDRRLLLVYLCLCFIPNVPHFILAVCGEKGAGKSFLLRLIRRLVDPAGLELASLPHDKSELALHLSSNYFAAYDNLDGLQGWQSDMLCCAATGGGVSKRELYSDQDEVILKFRHCIGLNGITNFVNRPDLMDRTILIELQRIDEHDRSTEKEIEAEFEHARPFILGGIFDALSMARLLIDQIKPDTLPRMADAARWGAAIAEALGIGSAQFFSDLATNAGQANDETIRSNPVAAAITAMMADRDGWDGTPADLLEALRHVAAQEAINTFARTWPNSAEALSKRIKLVRSNLRDSGIEVESYREAGGIRQRKLAIRKTSSKVHGELSQPSEPSQETGNSSIFNAFETGQFQ